VRVHVGNGGCGCACACWYVCIRACICVVESAQYLSYDYLVNSPFLTHPKRILIEHAPATHTNSNTQHTHADTCIWGAEGERQTDQNSKTLGMTY